MIITGVLRSAQSHHQRRLLARGYELALRRAERPHAALSAAAPLRASELLACRPIVLDVIDRLRDEGREVRPDAVHRARELLCCPSGPLFGDGDLTVELRAVRDELAAPVPTGRWAERCVALTQAGAQRA